MDMTPEKVEHVLRTQHRVCPEAEAAREVTAVLRRRLHAFAVALWFALVAATLGAACVMSTAPGYAIDHTTATIDELREAVRRQVNQTRRLEAIDLLEVKARSAIKAIEDARDTMTMSRVDRAIKRIREDVQK